jgi:hypothetical protein
LDLFCRTFFWRSNLFFSLWFYVTCCWLIELIQVDLNIFSLIFFMIFFSISTFYIKLFTIELCHFSLFLLFSYSESGLVKLTRIGSGFLLLFFIELWFFYQVILLIFFIPISYHGLLVHQITLSWLGFSSSFFKVVFCFHLWH